MSTNRPDDLEKRFDTVLRSLPDRPAPASLEARVMAELARRAGLPWWHRSYMGWPPAIKGVFLFVSAAVAALMIVGCMQLMRGTTVDVTARPLAEWHMLRTAVTSVIDVFGRLLPGISTTVFYGVLAVVLAMYASVFGLGAAAYRYLWKNI